MSYLNIRTPKFYTDHVNFLLSNGSLQNSSAMASDNSIVYDVATGSDLINTFTVGSEDELFDMRPMNTVTFTTNTNATVRADHVLININKQTANFKTDYVAILNHNMATAKAKVRVASSDTLAHIQSADMSSATAIPSVTEIINADAISSNFIKPATDGSTIFTFTANDDLYYGIQFEGTGSESDTNTGDGLFDDSENLRIGCIMIGEHYTMPQSPDINVRRSIVFDGVSVQQTLGGQKYANATHLGKRFQNSKKKSPFSLSTHNSEIPGGRIIYDMQFSYVPGFELIPNNIYDEYESGDMFYGDVWNRVKGNLIPFILSIDSSNTGARAENSMMFARFGENSFNATQVAPDIWNISVRIEEEF